MLNSKDKATCTLYRTKKLLAGAYIQCETSTSCFNGKNLSGFLMTPGLTLRRLCRSSMNFMRPLSEGLFLICSSPYHRTASSPPWYGVSRWTSPLPLLVDSSMALTLTIYGHATRQTSTRRNIVRGGTFMRNAEQHEVIVLWLVRHMAVMARELSGLLHRSGAFRRPPSLWRPSFSGSWSRIDYLRLSPTTFLHRIEKL